MKKLAKQLFPGAFASGATYEEMSRTLGVTMRQLFRWARELDLPRRPRGGQR